MATYAALDYTQRLGAIERENGEVRGIFIEWGEIRMADDCAQTRLRIQTTTNDMQRLLGRK